MDSGHRPVLSWRADQRVPMGDAAVEFFLGDQRLGLPQIEADGRTLRLALPDVGNRDLSELQVRAGGRRIDVGGPAARRSAKVVVPPVPALAPRNAVDPGVAGSHRTVEGEYVLPPVRLPDFPEPVEMRGMVVAPAGASGARPLVLMLHGRHSTCYTNVGEGELSSDWPCRTGAMPVPSYRGYLQAQRLLASQGYVTVSISANGINGQDGGVDDGGAQARSSLVRSHLAQWADWTGPRRATAPAVVRAAARADLSRVLLMGHSRGGEGVNRAATDSLSPPPAGRDGYHGTVRWTIRGTVLIGPTIFGDNPAPDVPSTTILPGCDGDVVDLQGQRYIDGTGGVSRGTALHSALYVVGANHNFFNTEWTPGQAVAPAFDDFEDSAELPDPVCSVGTATRLSAAQQQTVGATYLAASARLFLGGDDRVRPLLDGSGVRAPSADPARVLSHALGAARTPLVLPAATRVSGPGARRCDELPSRPGTECLEPGGLESSPHFVSLNGAADPDRSAMVMQWSSPGRPVTLAPARPVSIAGARSLALRIAVPANTVGTRLAVSVTDIHGRRAELGEFGLDGLPGSPRTSSDWAQEVRLPLTPRRFNQGRVDLGRVDLGRIASLRLVPRSGAGRAWLLDAWGWRPGLPTVRPAALPRIDVGSLSVDEGNSGVRRYRVPTRVSGSGAGQVRLFFTNPTTFTTTTRLFTVLPGTRMLDIPVEVTGNVLYGRDHLYAVSAKAVRGTVVGGYRGGLESRNDDPAPVVSLTPATQQVTEGSPLTWRVTLSAPTEDGMPMYLEVEQPETGPELSTTDVDPDWFAAETFENPLPSRPLSQVSIFLFAVVRPGQLAAEVSVPTVVDTDVEPAEHLQLELVVFSSGVAVSATGGDGSASASVVSGTVVDSA